MNEHDSTTVWFAQTTFGRNMNHEALEVIINRIRAIADELNSASEESDEWFARNNLVWFAAELEAAASLEQIMRASHSLRYAITDSWDWNTTLARQVSSLVAEAEVAAKRNQ